MPHTISDLISSRNLSRADVTATLEAAGLSQDLETYSDEDITGKFDVIRSYFTEGLVSDYQAARELLALQTASKDTKSRQPKAVDVGKGRRQKNSSLNSTSSTSTTSTAPGAQERTNPANFTPNSIPGSAPNPVPLSTAHGQQDNAGDSSKASVSISDLLNLAKEQLGITLTLRQVISVLEAGGLPDKEFYTKTEGQRFLLACSVITGGGTQDITTVLENTIAASEVGLLGLMNEITSGRAKHLPALAKQLYLQNAVLSLAQNEEDIEDFFMQLKDSILAGIEGKTPLSSILEVDWIAKPLSASPPLPNQSLLTSENITTIELNNESKSSSEP